MWAQLFNTALAQEDWTPEQRAAIDPYVYPNKPESSTGLAQHARLVIQQLFAKKKGEDPDDADIVVYSDSSRCMMGEFNIFDEPWSSAHEGFTDHLRDDLKVLYFSLPERDAPLY